MVEFPSLLVDVGTPASATTVRVRVVDVGLACCAVELSAAWTSGLLRSLRRIAPARGPQGPAAAAPEVLVVAGTVTDVVLPDLLSTYEELGRPRVMSFGACAGTGGPYWDSYSVCNGVDQVIPVDRYVPGCPPPPASFVAALRELVSGA